MTATSVAAASGPRIQVFDATALYNEVASRIDALGGWNPSVVRDIVRYLDTGRPEHESELDEDSVVVVQVASSTEHAMREKAFCGNRLDPTLPLEGV